MFDAQHFKERVPMRAEQQLAFVFVFFRKTYSQVGARRLSKDSTKYFIAVIVCLVERVVGALIF